MVLFGENLEQNKYRKVIKTGIPILKGQDLTKDMVLDIMGHHLAHILLTDLVFGSDFCGAIFAGMMVMNQCLLSQHRIFPADIVAEAYRLLQNS